MPRNVTQEDVEVRCLGYGYELLDKYKGSKYKHLIRHTSCGYEWEVFLSNVSKMKGCPSCADRKLWNKERLREYLEGSDYMYLEQFLPDIIKTHTKLTLMRKDGFVVETTIDKLKESEGSSYRKCHIDDFTFNTILLNKGCSLLSSTDLDDTMRCHICNHTWTRKKKHVRWKYRQEAVPCPNCRKTDHLDTGFNPDKPGTFYYLRVETNNKPLYKIGITNRTVEKRFTLSDMDKITILRTLTFEEGRSASDLEKYYLNIFKDYKYKGDPVLSSGNTELFTHDILHLDKLTD